MVGGPCECVHVEIVLKIVAVHGEVVLDGIDEHGGRMVVDAAVKVERRV